MNNPGYNYLYETDVVPTPTITELLGTIIEPAQVVGNGAPTPFADQTGDHIYRQATQPTATQGAKNGDIWYDTGNKNKPYKLIANAWTSIQDTTATTTPSLLGWAQTMTWSATDYRIVAWSSGSITTADGTSYSISSGNTGNMAAITYIYLDTSISLTALQTTTTASTAVGLNKIVVGVAKQNSDTTKNATFIAFGTNAQGVFIVANNIATDTITANEIAANTLTVSEILFGSFMKLPDDATLASYWAFDEYSGSTVVDHSTAANNGSTTGAIYAAGVSGTALDFDGIDDYVSIADNAAIQNIWDGSGSVSFWINPDTLGEGSSGQILSKHNAGYTTGWFVGLSGQTGSNVGIQFAQYFATSSTGCTTTRSVPINSWSHIVIVYNSDSGANTPTIYLNGTPLTNSASNQGTGTRATDVGQNLYIGNNAATTTTFDGKIDEVRWYTNTLTQREIVALYLNPTGNQATRIGPTQITTTTLSAISANLGSITAGSISINGGVASIDSAGVAILQDVKVTAKPGSNVFEPKMLDTIYAGFTTGATADLFVGQVSHNVTEGVNSDILFGASVSSIAAPGLILRFQQLSTTATPALSSYWRSYGYGDTTGLAAGLRGIIKIGSFVYYSSSDSTMRRVTDTLGTNTAMTFGSNACTGPMSWDQSNSYLLIQSSTTNVRRFTISGTTLTFVDNITLDTAIDASQSGFLFDGTNYFGYASASGVLRKFNSSGVQQTTLTIGTSLPGFVGLVKLNGILHGAFRSGGDMLVAFAAIGSGANAVCPSSVTLIALNSF